MLLPTHAERHERWFTFTIKLQEYEKFSLIHLELQKSSYIQSETSGACKI